MIRLLRFMVLLRVLLRKLIPRRRGEFYLEYKYGFTTSVDKPVLFTRFHPKDLWFNKEHGYLVHEKRAKVPRSPGEHTNWLRKL